MHLWPNLEPDDPCTCGSGKPHQACCMRPEEEARWELDRQVLAGILSWAYDARPDPTRPPIDPIPPRLRQSPHELAFYLRWRFYTWLPVGVSLLESYLVARHHTLSPAESGWIGAQVLAWLGIWENLEARPGVGMRLRDQLTGEERFVFETTGWNELRVGSSVLGRVVSFSQKACFCGIHPRSMPRSSAALVAHRARELVARGRPLPEGAPIPVAWMQEEGTAEMIVDLWDYVVANSAPGPSRKSVS